jgi:hypothetical protein
MKGYINLDKVSIKDYWEKCGESKDNLRRTSIMEIESTGLLMGRKERGFTRLIS